MSARLAGLAALLMALAPAAWAHGGDEVASGANAHYTMSVQASSARDADGRPAVDLTAYPIRRANGAAERDATVAVRIDSRPPIRARPTGDGYEAIVPVPAGEDWRRWRIRASVRGVAGALTVVGAGSAPARADQRPDWTWPSGLVLVLVGAAVVVVVRRRRSAL